MKIVVIGGAGVRTPLLMPALARRQERLDLRQVVLVDRDEARLELMAPLIQHAAQRHNATFDLSWTTEAAEALTGADAVITTIRVGGEEARVLDERIARRHGVLAQETTGVGGFAMALRSIPVIAEYAQMMREMCPHAWLLNFTNPAGLVAQAMVTQFPDLKVAGICDTPMGLQSAVAHAFQRRPDQVSARFFGLNHLSWLAEAVIDGENVVPRIVADPELASRIEELSLFEPGLLRLLGILPNEYLYFYYYRERAVANIASAEETRGEQVRRLSRELIQELREIDPAANPTSAHHRYQRYLHSRHGSYLAMETGGAIQHQGDRETESDPQAEGEGYAGVALDILAPAGKLAEVVANVPNGGAIPGMRADDAVEVTCHRDATGLHPVPFERVPEEELLLMQTVKQYERLTVEAIRTHSRQSAIEALMTHPLIGSYSLAEGLLSDILKVHRQYVGEWSA